MFSMANIAKVVFEFVVIMVLFAIYNVLKLVTLKAWKAIKSRRNSKLVEVKP